VSFFSLNFSSDYSVSVSCFAPNGLAGKLLRSNRLNYF
jgi:hypothetical protein